jgi:hypothetical protein
VKRPYIAAVLAVVSFYAHAGTNFNNLRLKGFRLNGLDARNGLHLNGAQLKGAPDMSASTNAMVDLAGRPLVVQE